MPTTITLTGFKEFEAKLKAMPKILQEEIGGEVRYSGEYWAGLAKRDAPVDNGILVGLIDAKHDKPLESEVTSSAYYSPYVEWGTGSRAKIPMDLVAYAAQWWTKKIHIGQYPHPFFFIQVPLVEKQLFEKVKKILTTEH